MKVNVAAMFVLMAVVVVAANDESMENYEVAEALGLDSQPQPQPLMVPLTLIPSADSTGAGTLHSCIHVFIYNIYICFLVS